MQIRSGKRGFGGANRDGGALDTNAGSAHGDLAGGTVMVVSEGAAQRVVMAELTKDEGAGEGRSQSAASAPRPRRCRSGKRHLRGKVNRLQTGGRGFAAALASSES